MNPTPETKQKRQTCQINYALWWCSEHQQPLNDQGKCCQRHWKRNPRKTP